MPIIDGVNYTKCFLCEGTFQYGPGLYDGKPAWGKLMIRNSCRKTNWDGLVVSHHPRLKEFLKTEGIPYTLNGRGWLDIPWT
jgi:hypothetical protein